MRAFYLSCASLLLCACAWGGSYAVDHDGTDDKVDYDTTGELLDADTTYSVAAWVRFHDTAATQTVLSRRRIASANTLFYSLYLTGGNIRLLVRDDANTAGVATGGAVTQDEWMHVVGVRNGNGIELFTNGVSAATDTDSFGAFTTDAEAVGAWNAIGTWGNFLNGDAAQVLVYRDALTDQEIATIYATRGRTYPRDNLVLDLDNPAGMATGDSMDGLTFPDRSGNGNSGTGDDGANNTGLAATGTIVRKRGAKQQ